jgi:hypothetical protein
VLDGWTRATAAALPPTPQPCSGSCAAWKKTAQHDYGTASRLAGDLINLYQASGRLDQALTLAGAKADYTRRAGHGPLDPTRRPGLAAADPPPAGPLAAGPRRSRPAPRRHGRPPDPPDSVITPWNVRETTLTTGVLPQPRCSSGSGPSTSTPKPSNPQRRRSAADAEQAYIAFNNYGPLLWLGRAAEARDLLRRCLHIFEGTNDIP